MANKYMIDGSTLTNLAEKVRDYVDSTNTLTPAEMATAIQTETNNINTEITEQDNLIAQIKAAIASKKGI